MQTALNIYFFLLGLALASFLNALMYRVDKEFKYPEIFTQPSHCEKCKKKLKWYDLIPILSYILSKGKCTKCKTRINIYYPASELVLGLSLMLLFHTSAPWYSYLILLMLFSLTYFDIKYNAIPQTPTLLFLSLSAIYLIVTSVIQQQLILNALPSGFLLIGGITVILILMYGVKNLKEGFGFGDFLILLSLSAFLSTRYFWIMFFISILLSLTVSIYGFVTKEFTRKTALPLLPFFSLGYIVVVTYGDEILQYLSQTIAIG